MMYGDTMIDMARIHVEQREQEAQTHHRVAEAFKARRAAERWSPFKLFQRNMRAKGPQANCCPAGA